MERQSSFAGSGRFGGGGFADRRPDAGFGRGGWGDIHNAGAFTLIAAPALQRQRHLLRSSRDPG
jgi:hypothetical protein